MMETLYLKAALRVALILILSTLAVPAQFTVPAPAGTNVAGPRIQFGESVHDFGKISTSSAFKHDYVFTNTGNARLEVTEVRTSCGCAVAGDWTRVVEPGQTGIIPIQLSTTNLSGPLLKAVSVSCNDTNHSLVQLQVKALIWKPIDVTPQMVIFNLSADMLTNQTKAVRIVDYTGQTLTLSEPESAHKSISAEIKTITPGKEYDLLITAKPPFSGTSIQTPVTVKTSSTNLPVISVNTIGIIQPVIGIMPNQITLPRAPLSSNMQAGVTLRFNGSGMMKVSEASAGFVTTRAGAGDDAPNTKPIPGVNIRVQELQPGRFYNVVVIFPAGLEIRPGQSAELSLKTSHPQYPVIRVPIYQMAPLVPASASVPVPGTGLPK
jgi:hypothetical protein